MRTLLSIGAFLGACLLALLASPAAGQHPRDGLLMLVDHAATSVEAASRCEQHLPGSGVAIREAYARWHAQHHAAHAQMMEALVEVVQAQVTARGQSISARQLLDGMRVVSVEKLRQSMDAKDAASLNQFCTNLPAEYDKPEMDFTAMWLRRQSRK